MRALSTMVLCILLLDCGAAAAATAPAAEVSANPAAAPAAQQPLRELDPVHVNAMRNPEIRKYAAILAGLDAFDRHHELAPAVDRLRFRVSAMRKDTSPIPLAVRLVGDGGFQLPLAIDSAGRFEVPRSDAAEDADSELELNRKRYHYRFTPDIRTPGLPVGQRRLGDLRLECKVTVAIAKEEIPLFWVMAVNTILLTSDWCSFFNEKHNARFGFEADGRILGAVLRESGRTLALQTRKTSFEVPIGSPDWSDDAVVELTYAQPAAESAPELAPAQASEPATAPTGTAGETPRTAP